MGDTNRIVSMDPDVHQKIVSIVAEVLQIEIGDCNDNLLRKDRNEWDSVNHLRLAIELEEIFGILLDQERWVDIMTIREIEILISEALKESEKTANSE